MKIFRTLIGVSLFIFSSLALSSPKYGMAGCGLGSVVMGPKGNQILAATTNGTSGSQPFGILTGTSNCAAPEKMKQAQNQQDFVTNHLSALARDASRGEGDSLSAFAATLGCEVSAQPKLNNTLQKNHGVIFSQPGAVSILEEAKSILKQDSSLTKSCKHLG